MLEAHPASFLVLLARIAVLAAATAAAVHCAAAVVGVCAYPSRSSARVLHSFRWSRGISASAAVLRGSMQRWPPVLWELEALQCCMSLFRPTRAAARICTVCGRIACRCASCSCTAGGATDPLVPLALLGFFPEVLSSSHGIPSAAAILPIFRGRPSMGWTERSSSRWSLSRSRSALPSLIRTSKNNLVQRYTLLGTLGASRSWIFLLACWLVGYRVSWRIVASAPSPAGAVGGFGGARRRYFLEHQRRICIYILCIHREDYVNNRKIGRCSVTYLFKRFHLVQSDRKKMQWSLRGEDQLVFRICHG